VSLLRPGSLFFRNFAAGLGRLAILSRISSWWQSVRHRHKPIALTETLQENTRMTAHEKAGNKRLLAVLLYPVWLLLATVCIAAPPQGRFIDPRPVAGIEMPSDGQNPAELYPMISADGLELFFRSDVGNNPELWVASRSDPNGPFEEVSILAELNSPADDNTGGISADALTIYFGSNRNGNFDMYQATRPARDAPFENVTLLSADLSTSSTENFPFVTPDGLTLYYHRSDEVGQPRIWTATRESTDDQFTGGRDLGDVVNDSAPTVQWKPSVSSDGLTLFFSDGFFNPPRPGGKGDLDIWVSYRESLDADFGTPMNLNDLWPESSVNTVGLEGMAYISADWPAFGSKLYYTTLGSGSGDLWEATWVAIDALAGDFNGNHLLDIEDLELLAQAVRGSSTEVQFDINADVTVDSRDIQVWIRELKQTFIGDANLDGEFNTTDLVQVFAAGKYEATERTPEGDILNPATWSAGDWNTDGEFTSSDLVLAFQDGGYEAGPRATLTAVPEPSGLFLLLIGLCGLLRVTRVW
jgi:hypothetical protein